MRSSLWRCLFTGQLYNTTLRYASVAPLLLPQPVRSIQSGVLRVDPGMLQGQSAGAQVAPGPGPSAGAQAAHRAQSTAQRASVDHGPVGGAGAGGGAAVRQATRSEAKELARNESAELKDMVVDVLDGAAEGVRNLIGATMPGNRCGARGLPFGGAPPACHAVLCCW